MSQMMQRCKCQIAAASAGLALLALSGLGCSRGKPLYPVTAQIYVDGRPAAGALVVLHPVNDSGPAAIRPSGYVDDGGNVKLMSFVTATRGTGEGAPAGEYIVTIAWFPTDVKEYLSKHPNTAVPDKLKGRYSQPDKSALRATVQPQPTTLPRIDLKNDAVVLPVPKRVVSRRRFGSSSLFALHYGGFSDG
jgi:hypothetical protein